MLSLQPLERWRSGWRGFGLFSLVLTGMNRSHFRITSDRLTGHVTGWVFRIAEVPVHWVHDPGMRISYNLQRALRIWSELFRIHKAQRVAWPAKVRS